MTHRNAQTLPSPGRRRSRLARIASWIVPALGVALVIVKLTSVAVRYL